MEDYDWIEVAYVLHRQPSVRTLEALFETFPNEPGPEYAADEFDITYWKSDGTRVNSFSDSEEAIKAISTFRVATVGVGLDGFELRIKMNQERGILSRVPHLTFAVSVHPFKGSDDDDRRSVVDKRRRDLVDVLVKSATILDPKWGFGRRGGLAIGENQSAEELSSDPLPPLYEYNVFRSETVEQLGRERVLSSPAWFVEELDIGGIFVAIQEPPESCWKQSEPCLKVADHLGVKLAETKRYH